MKATKGINGGLKIRVSASRSRADESIYVGLDSDRGGHANFWLTRGEAYDLAQRLQHEADWLARLDPQPAT